MKRVIIQANDLSPIRVSLPGHSVDEVGLNYFAFDAMAPLIYPFLQGTATMLSTGPLVINFPRALAKIPLCFFNVNGNAGQDFRSGSVRSFFCTADVYVNRVEFRYALQGAGVSFPVSYLLFEIY